MRRVNAHNVPQRTCESLQAHYDILVMADGDAEIAAVRGRGGGGCRAVAGCRSAAVAVAALDLPLAQRAVQAAGEPLMYARRMEGVAARKCLELLPTLKSALKRRGSHQQGIDMS